MEDLLLKNWHAKVAKIDVYVFLIYLGRGTGEHLQEAKEFMPYCRHRVVKFGERLNDVRKASG